MRSLEKVHPRQARGRQIILALMCARGFLFVMDPIEELSDAMPLIVATQNNLDVRVQNVGGRPVLTSKVKDEAEAQRLRALWEQRVGE
jgi:hypothetical protein